MSKTPFKVGSRITSLAVTVEGNAVTSIQLGGRARRTPASKFERHVARELREYLAGKRTDFTFPIRLEGSAFERKVWKALRRIPYGETWTYGEVAQAIGNPKAARAVGSANGRNPVPLVVPCHRVVAAGGKLGGFGGGLPLKRKLLALESVDSTD
ncbi:MAG: methylated-DNA--[protein]-cysteine S-methyltransferase [Gemmatimonadales bacterium]